MDPNSSLQVAKPTIAQNLASEAPRRPLPAALSWGKLGTGGRLAPKGVAEA
jgi:hypothetical protein